MIDLTRLFITLPAGTGVYGQTDGVMATAASFGSISFIAGDSRGEIFVSDSGLIIR